MKSAHRTQITSALVLATITLAGCGGGVYEEGESSANLCNGCDPPLPPPPPPPPPTPPGQRSVTITSSELYTAVDHILNRAELVIDTTQSAPPLIGPAQSIANPVYAQCQRDLAACAREPVAYRQMCRADVNGRCAGVPSSILQYTNVYSYLKVNETAKMFEATDVLFPLETFHHTGNVDFDIDVNYVHTTLGYGNWTAYFSPGFAANSGPLVELALFGLESQYPTVILTSTELADDFVPDVDLPIMEASVSLGRLVPTANKQAVDYLTADPSFYSEHDVSDLPDWMVEPFVDVEEKVRTKVEARIKAAFDKPSTHAALSKALTKLVSDTIKRTHPAGYLTIDQVTSSGSSIIVTYTPK